MSTSLQRMTLLLWMNAIFICSVAAPCTMPSDFRGTWLRGRDNKTLTFNDTHVSGLDVHLTGGKTHSVFECFIVEGTVLIVKSSTTFVAGLSGHFAHIYFCFDLRKVDAINYYMYERADTRPDFFEGARVIAEAAQTTVTFSMACTKQASEVPFFSLVRTDFIPTTATTAKSFPIAAIAAAVAALSLLALLALIICCKKRQSQVNAAPNTPMTAEEGDGKTADGNANGTAHANETANGKKPDGQTQGDQPSTTSKPNHIDANEPTEVDENSPPTRLPPP